MEVDVVLGLQYGDEAKAKCTYSLLNPYSDGKKEYDYAFRFNGGPNAGHTIYHNGKKIVTHQVPIGVFFEVPSIIGPGCVVDLEKLGHEVKEISKFLDKDISDYLFIDYRAHIITDEHKKLDASGSRIGSTRSGIAYAYSDKHLRIGKRFHEMNSSFNGIDSLKILSSENDYAVLFEGAQGWGLDINFGDYPFVTSSLCGIAGVIASGVRPTDIRNVIGIAKIYETYVGNKPFQEEGNEHLEKLQEIGQEIGATTGRKRQCNWLNLDRLIEACRVNQVTAIIINKIDILEKVGIFKCFFENDLKEFSSLIEMQDYITKVLEGSFGKDFPIVFSDNPYTI
jgi:adenylosuccinate synthase